MWTKDDYQEHMLGYIDGVRSEFERLVQSSFPQYDLNAFYTDLDTTFECLWRLIGARDADWEGFRYPLEASCARLLRALHPLPNPRSLALSDVAYHPKRTLSLLSIRVVQREPEIATSI